MKLPWWKYACNIQVISTIVVIIAVAYFAYNSKRKRFYYQGLGNSGWDLREWRHIFQGQFPQQQKRRNHRPRRYNKHEEECRRIFEKLFGTEFKSIRPKWLKNPVTKKNLELDGYCPHVRTPAGKGLAFEYDGEQHSKYNKHFHRHGPNEFLYQVKKDEWKDLRCKEEKVLLIRIPYFVAFNDLERYIISKLRKTGVQIRRYSSGIPSGNSSRNSYSYRQQRWSTNPLSSSGFLSGLYG